jgi:hypothetical protein
MAVGHQGGSRDTNLRLVPYQLHLAAFLLRAHSGCAVHSAAMLSAFWRQSDQQQRRAGQLYGYTHTENVLYMLLLAAVMAVPPLTPYPAVSVLLYL